MRRQYCAGDASAQQVAMTLPRRRDTGAGRRPCRRALGVVLVLLLVLLQLRAFIRAAWPSARCSYDTIASEVRRLWLPLALSRFYSCALELGAGQQAYVFGNLLNSVVADLPSSSLLTDYPHFDSCRALLEQHWVVMAEEATAATAACGGNLPEMAFIDPVQRGISNGTGWQALFFRAYGGNMPQNVHLAPRTAALLGARACSAVVMARFSVLLPGVSVPPHVGPLQIVGRYQLGLVVPEPSKVYLRFTGAAEQSLSGYHWHEGEGLLWDDKYEHEVVNTGSRTRIILMVDFEREDAPRRARLIFHLLLWVVRRTSQFRLAFERMGAIGCSKTLAAAA